MTIETRAVVEAALIPELLLKVAEEGVKGQDADKLKSKLMNDVEAYKSVLPRPQRETFKRHLQNTVTEVFQLMTNNKTSHRDTVAFFSVILELCSRLANDPRFKVTSDLAECVRTISNDMAEQHSDVWQGMLKAANKRADKVMQIFNKRGYYV